MCLHTSSGHTREMHQVDAKLKNKHNKSILQAHFYYVKEKSVKKILKVGTKNGLPYSNYEKS